MLDRNEPRKIFSEPQNDLKALPSTLHIFEEKVDEFQLETPWKRRKWGQIACKDKGGHFAGWKLFLRSMTADHSLSLVQIDDPVDAVAVHFVGGLLGMLLAPIFMDDG